MSIASTYLITHIPTNNWLIEISRVTSCEFKHALRVKLTNHLFEMYLFPHIFSLAMDHTWSHGAHPKHWALQCTPRSVSFAGWDEFLTNANDRKHINRHFKPKVCVHRFRCVGWLIEWDTKEQRKCETTNLFVLFFLWRLL